MLSFCRLTTDMKQALLGLLLIASPVFTGQAFADSVLSLQGYFGGSAACSDNGSTAAGCSAQIGSANAGTGAYTGGNLKLAGSGLVYTFNGSLEAGQGILAHSNPMSAFSATLPVPETSGNWIISGSATSSEFPGYALNIFVNGSSAGYIGNGSSTFLVRHALGAPLTFSLADNVSAILSNDIENLNFNLTFTDPPADPSSPTPEPALLPLIAIVMACFFIRPRESTSLC